MHARKPGSMRSALHAALLLAAAVSSAAAQDAAGPLALGIAATEARDPVAALGHFEAALATGSTLEAAWRGSIAAVDVGRLHAASADRTLRDSLLARAETLARTAIEADSTSADAWFALANALGRSALGLPARARVRQAGAVRDAALRAIALDSLHDGAYHVLGRWHAEVMRLSGVSRFFARRFLGGRIFGEASWDAAIGHLSRAAALDPTYIYHRLDLAEVLVERKRWDEARPHLEAIPGLPDRDIEDAVHRRRAAELLAETARRR
jgi:tetratricopeptide (TPR) repeat protein